MSCPPLEHVHRETVWGPKLSAPGSTLRELRSWHPWSSPKLAEQALPTEGTGVWVPFEGGAAMHWDVRNRGDKVRVLAALCYSVCISSFPALRTIVFVGTCVRVHTRMCVCVHTHTCMCLCSQRPDSAIRCLPQLLSTLFFEP